MGNVASFRTPICLVNADFARNLRDLADDIEGSIFTPVHLMVLILEADGTVERESYGRREFNNMDAVGVLEWAKMDTYNRARDAESP